MREYSVNLTPMLNAGIINSERQDFATDRAQDVFNFRTSQNGLRIREEVTMPFGASFSFPFPQFFRGHYDWLLCSETEVYLVDKNTYSLTLLATYNVNTLAPEVIQPGGRWHFVDLHNSWFLFNGSSVVWRADYDLISDSADLGYVYVNSDFRINTACLHKGRIVFGGFDPDLQWSPTQSMAFDEIQQGFTVFPDTKKPVLNQNFVAWTSIGDGSFLRMLLKDNFMEVGPFGENDNYNWTQWIVEALNRGDFGFIPMPFSGAVQALVPSGDTIVAYGTNGVAVLNEAPASDLFSGGYGVTSVPHVGIYDRGAVVNVQGAHMFVGNDGALYTFDQENGVRFLDYKHLIKPHVDGFEECALGYDPQEKDIYLSFFTGSYIFTVGKGLVRSGRILSTVERMPYGDLAVIGSSLETTLQFVSNSFDMDSTALKTITGINIGLNTTDAQTISVAVDYRYKRGQAYTRTPFITVNKESNVLMRVTALDFRVVVRGTLDVETDINYIEVRYQQADKRYRRGPSDFTATT